MRILCDLHHGDLFKSLVMLFAKRLGWEVYRPVGMDWFDAGFWRYLFPARATAEQFLNAENYSQYPGVTLAEYASGGFDVILSSTPTNFVSFERLRTQITPKVKHIFQSGNDWACPNGCRNFLNSTTRDAPADVNMVRYHQEFSLEEYRPAPFSADLIASFMHYPTVAPLVELQSALTPRHEWQLRVYGAGGIDPQPSDLAYAMREIKYLIHQKPVEAFGFNVHYAAACGKPIIMKVAANKHQTCGEFLTPETSIDMDRYSTPRALADAILEFDKNYDAHSRAIYRAFKAAVDFDYEEQKIRRFLERLQ